LFLLTNNSKYAILIFTKNNSNNFFVIIIINIIGFISDVSDFLKSIGIPVMPMDVKQSIIIRSAIMTDDIYDALWRCNKRTLPLLHKIIFHQIVEFYKKNFIRKFTT